MKHNLSFSGALRDLVHRLKNDLADIEDAKIRMKGRLNEAAALYGIDPAGARRLVSWLKQQQKANKNDPDQARQEELDHTYRTIVQGGVPAMPRRADGELDEVMALVNSNRPPKINDIMKAVSCSRGKAHKLRTLAIARLAAKSSCLAKTRELELPELKVALLRAGQDDAIL